MTVEKVKRIHLIYGICMSVLSLVLAILCIVLCLNIYYSGDDPFTRHSIGKSFSYIAALVYLYIATIIGGVVLNRILPMEKKRLKGTVSEAGILYRLCAKIDSFSKDAKEKIERERATRFIMIVISTVLLLGATVASLIHVPIAFDANNPSTNKEVFFGGLLIARYFIIPIAYLIITAYVCKRSVRTELQIAKDELKALKDALPPSGDKESCGEVGTFTRLTAELQETVKNASEPKKWHRVLSLTIKCTVGCLAVAFIIIGIINGGDVDVVNKACQICRECIGMG